MNPILSIIVPVYNSETFIDRCVDSILNQTFKDFELILVDDGSSDNSLFKCRNLSSHDTRIRVIHKDNGGVSSARNEGLNEARGEWIAFVDSDDWISSNMYKEMLDRAEVECADLVMCDINMFWGPNESAIIHEKCIVPSHDKIKTLNDYVQSSWTCTYNLIAKKSIYTEYNLRFPDGIAYCEDFHLTFRLLFYANSIAKINEPFYFYNRVNEASAVNNLNTKKQRDRCWCDKEILCFIDKNNLLQDLERAMSYRILAYTQEWVLNYLLWDEFRTFYPKSHLYILSCDKVVPWRRLLMWLVANKINGIARLILYLKSVRNKIHSILK